jgi:hypothetical protein
VLAQKTSCREPVKAITVLVFADNSYGFFLYLKFVLLPYY